MRIKIFVILATIGLALMLAAQTTDRFSATAFDTDHLLIPATPTTLFSSTVYIDELTLSNVGASEVTVTIADRQQTPMTFMNAVKIAPNSVAVAALKSHKFPGGITWSASASNAVVGYMSGRR